ncbi:MAG: O-antigen ligase family protein [Bacteroidetes bacterium]|nr:O-antigen ligase family protein [Bacteroidota bacterium]
MIGINLRKSFSAYYLVLILLAMSLPLSKYTMGLFQIILSLIWLINGVNSKNISGKFSLAALLLSFWNSLVFKLNLLYKNKIALIVIGLYLINVSGLIHATDYNYVLTDLRVKGPLLILPLIIVSMPSISKQQLTTLLLFYVGAVLISTLFSGFELIKKDYTDIREISVFISPIRLSLNICFSIFILIGLILKNEISQPWLKIIVLVVTMWFLYIIIKLESGIAILIIPSVSLILFIQQIRKIKSGLLKLIAITIITLFPIITIFYLNTCVQEFYNVPHNALSQLDSKTSRGNNYIHDTSSFYIEDGKYPGLYISPVELSEAWNNRSNINFNRTDKMGQPLKSTLIRFLASKNLRKDADGLNQLTNDEITWIENGIANANYIYHPGLKTRISKELFGYGVYKKTGDPNGKSIVQRLEYWKASINIISKNWFFGVGTGNIPSAFKEAYANLGSRLNQKNRMESHNQYLLILMTFGIIGFLWLAFCFFYPGLKLKTFKTNTYWIFALIILISMITEDTLETQTGVTFFAFFNSIFLLGNADNS